jgi:glyceraldehyde-3-phosphate dehydrogenase (NADP+)
MMSEKMFIGGEWLDSKDENQVINPYDATFVARTFFASKEQLNLAVEAAQSSFSVTKQLLPFEKEAVLDQIISGIKERHEDFVQTIIAESGKPRVYAEGEVNRALQCLKVAKEECKRVSGEIIDLSWTNIGTPKKGMIEYFPIGVVAGITPFNFPLNLVMHKVAPAIAVGCPIIIKPASKTPLTALLLAEVIEKSDWPKGAFSVIPCSREVGQALVEDERIKLLSFTGSPVVGWKMKSNAGKKKVVLELGGNAAAIVHKDTDLSESISKLIVGSFAYSGQVCIHTQQIFVHEDLFDLFMKSFLERTQTLNQGNPNNLDCQIGPMISEKEMNRAISWVTEAIDQGAILKTGNTNEGLIMSPTILTNTNPSMKVVKEEIFAPVVVIEKYQTQEEVISRINYAKFGLQASLFTDNHSFIKKAFRELEVGALILNESTTFRVDHMPYGGVKDSGLGREGVKYAMQDMLEMKMLVD